jgi:hypothetical protein
LNSTADRPVSNERERLIQFKPISKVMSFEQKGWAKLADRLVHWACVKDDHLHFRNSLIP